MSVIPNLTSGGCALDFKGDVSFQSRPLVGAKIISFFVHQINRWLSSQSGMSIVAHGHSKASKSYPFSSTRRTGICQASRRVTYICVYIHRFYSCLNRRQWCRSQSPRSLRRGTATTRLLGLRVRILPGVYMSVSCGRCVLSGTGLFFGLITRPEESYRVWSVDNAEVLAHWGLSCHKRKSSQ